MSKIVYMTNKYYITESPDKARHILCEDIKTCIDQARNRLETTASKSVYIVKIIRVLKKVEPKPIIQINLFDVE